MLGQTELQAAAAAHGRQHSERGGRPLQLQLLELLLMLTRVRERVGIP